MGQEIYNPFLFARTFLVVIPLLDYSFPGWLYPLGSGKDMGDITVTICCCVLQQQSAMVTF